MLLLLWLLFFEATGNVVVAVLGRWAAILILLLSFLSTAKKV